MLKNFAGRPSTWTGDAGAAPTGQRQRHHHNCADDAVFRRPVRHLHALGPRATGEVFARIVAAYPQAGEIVEEELTRLTSLDPDFVRWVGGHDWLEPVAVVCPVAGERP